MNQMFLEEIALFVFAQHVLSLQGSDTSTYGRGWAGGGAEHQKIKASLSPDH